MKKYFLRSMLICLLFALYTSVNAQVTIGSGTSPNNGVLLDIKEIDDATGGSNATAGVMFPRVQLTDAYSLIDIPDASANAIPDPTAKDAEELKYTGLTVYNIGNALPGTNTNAVPVGQAGIYVWDGTQWASLTAGGTTPPTPSDLKTFLKAYGSSGMNLINLNLELIGSGSLLDLNGIKIIGFNTEEFDLNNEFAYDATAGASVYTAKQAGIYSVYAQLKSSGNLVDAGILGIGVIKRAAGGNRYEMVAQEAFLNVTVGLKVLNDILRPITSIVNLIGGVVNTLVIGSDPIPVLTNVINFDDVNVTPPYRKVQTLLQLNEGDQIAIVLITSITSLGLLGETDAGGQDTFFTIHQVH